MRSKPEPEDDNGDDDVDKQTEGPNTGSGATAEDGVGPHEDRGGPGKER